MKNKFYVYLLVSLCLINVSAVAENRAVNIEITSGGGALDDAALHKARKVVGQAITDNAVDSFIVYSPRVGGPIFREGGISACAEAGFSASTKQWDNFVKQLQRVHAKQGTYVNITPVVNCNPVEPLACGGITGKQCPAGLACVDDPKDNCDPAQGGADCSGVCVQESK
jgi:hypothetical protein